MASAEKHYYIAHHELREKYQGYCDRIKSLSKAIADASHTKINVELKKNKTISFIITGGKRGIEKALNSIQNEFEKKGYSKQPPRHKTVFLDEVAHKKLHQEFSQHQEKKYLLTEDTLRKFDILTGAIELRQFACAKCNRPWWANVPRTKPVSTCKSCHVLYDALERDKEFGIGRYMCTDCDHFFYARCEATEFHLCYKCEKLTGPPYINPRFKGHRSFKASRGKPLITPLKIIHASTPHDSTGSTIRSFITDDLGSDIEVNLVKRAHTLAAKDYRHPKEEPSATSSYAVGHSVRSTPGEVGDPELLRVFLQSAPEVPTADIEVDPGISELDTESVPLRKRTMASDSSDSDSSPSDSSDDLSQSDNDSTRPNVDSSQSGSDDGDDGDDSEGDILSTAGQSSEPDSGIGTCSNPRTSSSEMGTASSSTKPFVNPSMCDFKSEYPGIVFSKEKAEKKITSAGGCIDGEGVKLQVPEGAVKLEDDVRISLQACFGGPFSLPDDLVFVSPVYLIEPPFAFHQNLKLTIDLFVELETEDDCSDIVFVTSPTKYVSDKGSDVHWKFRSYGTPEVSMAHGDERCKGIMNLKHFCFGGFASRIGASKKFSYFAVLYKPSFFCLPESHAIFSASLHHKVYTKNLERYIENEYGSIKNFKTISKSFSFSPEKSISFILPTEDAKRQGYDLTSNISPCKITKKEVDFARHTKKQNIGAITLYPPKLVLTISYLNQSVTSALRFSLKLEGILEDCAFNVSIHPATSTSKPDLRKLSGHKARSLSSENIESSPLSESSDAFITQSSSGYSSQGSQEALGLDEEPNFGALFNYLYKLAPEWEMLACFLDLRDETMAIEVDGTDVKDKLRRVLQMWERLRQRPYSWRTIIDVLEQPAMEAKSIACKIRDDIAR